MKEVHRISEGVADICPIFETTPQYVNEPRTAVLIAEVQRPVPKS